MVISTFERFFLSSQYDRKTAPEHLTNNPGSKLGTYWKRNLGFEAHDNQTHLFVTFLKTVTQERKEPKLQVLAAVGLAGISTCIFPTTQGNQMRVQMVSHGGFFEPNFLGPKKIHEKSKSQVSNRISTSSMP